MPQDAPNAPAGWYPDPEGGQRYWDGEKWLNIPAPESTLNQSPTKSDSGMSSQTKKYLFIGAGVLVIVLLVVAGAVASQEQSRKQEIAQQAVQERKAEAKALEEEMRLLEERNVQVAEIVESVKGAAQKMIDEGDIEGSVLDAYCNPVAGGSLEDIQETTTAFECFVATVDNGDGTQNGYFWDVLKNWDTGRYTWDFRDN